MKKGTVREVLNRIMYTASEEEKPEYRIVIIDRSSPSGLREIEFSRVTRVTSRYLYLGESVVIPLHRVVEIKHLGKTVWCR